MSTNPELIFCDLCNESVPLTDLATGKAMRVKDRVLGACCLGALRRPAAERVERKTGGAGGAVAAILVLAGIAAGVAFLDWRLSEDVGQVARRLDGVETELRSGHERVVKLEEAVTQVGGRIDFAPIQARLEGIEGRVDQQRNSVDLRLTRLEEAAQAAAASARAGDAAHREDLAALRSALQGVAADVAALRAQPAAAPRPEEPRSEPAVPAPAAVAEPDLPPELKHHVLSLADDDPGTRFASVDKLLASRDLRVLPSLLPMAKDANAFVRRLVVEGLRDFRRPESVDTLLVALADLESIVRLTAHASLRTLTAQSFEFDDSSPTTRATAQRRWQDWWDKNRASYAF
jgi:hypothetical protein